MHSQCQTQTTTGTVENNWSRFASDKHVEDQVHCALEKPSQFSLENIIETPHRGQLRHNVSKASTVQMYSADDGPILTKVCRLWIVEGHHRYPATCLGWFQNHGIRLVQFKLMFIELLLRFCFGKTCFIFYYILNLNPRVSLEKS